MKPLKKPTLMMAFKCSFIHCPSFCTILEGNYHFCNFGSRRGFGSLWWSIRRWGWIFDIWHILFLKFTICYLHGPILRPIHYYIVISYPIDPLMSGASANVLILNSPTTTLPAAMIVKLRGHIAGASTDIVEVHKKDSVLVPWYFLIHPLYSKYVDTDNLLLIPVCCSGWRPPRCP